MIIKTEKIGGLSVWTDQNPRKGKTTVTVYFEYRPIVSFDSNKINERRLAVVQLVELGYCKNRIAGKICGFHRNTVSKLLRTKRLLGIEAIFEDNRGPKAPWKYIDSIRKTIKNLIREHPDWTDKQIADAAAKQLETTISRSAVARIRIANQDMEVERPTKHDLEQLAKIADAIDVKQHDERQLSFNFEDDPEFKKQVDEFADEDAPKPKTDTDKKFLDGLQEGQRNVFAGMLFHHLFLDHISFPNAFDFPSSINNTYDDYEVMEAILFGLNIGLPSIESHKLVNSQDIGLLLGRTSSPDETTIRLRLKQMAEFNPSESLIDHFADLFLSLGFINPEVFFIDGHFLPYYGLKVLAKGYHTVRRSIMKGNEIYVVSDLDGKPLFSITEGCDIDFRPIIIRAADKIISLGIDRPILVFDRGGYGVHFFSELSTRTDFVTWAKYVKKDELKDLKYTSCLMFHGKRYLIAEKTKLIRESISTAIKEGRTEATSTEVRMVVFKELDKDRPVAIYTSNYQNPAPDIAAYMLSRWGESENFFKEIMSLYNFNYHPGYDLKELEEQPLVDNPEVKTIKKTIKGIKQKMGQLAFKKQEAESKTKTQKDIRLEKKMEELQKEIDEYNKELEAFHAALKDMPDKISIIEVLQGRPMNKADLEKKKIYDLIQMVTFHSREHLVSLFRSCYDDPRDVKQILTKITKLAGNVKLVGETLVVLLDWIEDKKHREAAIRFCHLINGMSPKLKGRMEFKLYFRISSIPQGAYRGQKQMHNLS
jgi:transposase